VHISLYFRWAKHIIFFEKIHNTRKYILLNRTLIHKNFKSPLQNTSSTNRVWKLEWLHKQYSPRSKGQLQNLPIVGHVAFALSYLENMNLTPPTLHCKIVACSKTPLVGVLQLKLLCQYGWSIPQHLGSTHLLPFPKTTKVHQWWYKWKQLTTITSQSGNSKLQNSRL
jgi:hypothetical protein